MWQYRRVGGELPDVMPPVLKAADSNWPTAVAVVQRQCVNVLLDTAAVSYRDCDISITDSSQATLCPCTYSLLHTGALRTISNTRLKDDVTTYRRATAMGDESTRCPGTRVVLCRQSSTELWDRPVIEPRERCLLCGQAGPPQLSTNRPIPHDRLPRSLHS